MRRHLTVGQKTTDGPMVWQLHNSSRSLVQYIPYLRFDLTNDFACKPSTMHHQSFDKNLSHGPDCIVLSNHLFMLPFVAARCVESETSSNPDPGCGPAIGCLFIRRAKERTNGGLQGGREAGKVDGRIIEQSRFEPRHVGWCFSLSWSF